MSEVTKTLRCLFPLPSPGEFVACAIAYGLGLATGVFGWLWATLAYLAVLGILFALLGVLAYVGDHLKRDAA